MTQKKQNNQNAKMTIFVEMHSIRTLVIYLLKKLESQDIFVEILCGKR